MESDDRRWEDHRLTEEEYRASIARQYPDPESGISLSSESQVSAFKIDPLNEIFNRIKVLEARIVEGQRVYADEGNWEVHYPGTRYGTNDQEVDVFDPKGETREKYYEGINAQKELKELLEHESPEVRTFVKKTRKRLGLEQNLPSGCLTISGGAAGVFFCAYQILNNFFN